MGDASVELLLPFGRGGRQLLWSGGGGGSQEVGSQGRPRRFRGDVRYDLLGLAVEGVHNCGSDDVLSGGPQAICVALDRIMRCRPPGR